MTKQETKEYNKIYYLKNKDKIKEQVKKYAESNKSKIFNYQKDYRIKNKESLTEYIKQYKKEWDINNPNYYNNYKKERRLKDPIERLKHNLRNRTYNAFKINQWKKGKGTELLLGGDIDLIKKSLESKFKKGMSWDNYGDWHVDHIIPLKSANTEKELRALCNYKNLQPLWAKENLSKGAKFIK